MNALFRREPVRVQLVALIAIAVLTRLGLKVDPTTELLIDAAAFWFVGEITRLFTSPAKPTPTAAGKPAKPKEHPIVNATEFVAQAKAGMAKATALAEELWAAMPPEFQHPALDAAKAGLSDLGELAKSEVTAAGAPKPLADAIDDEIAVVESKLAALQSAKAAVAA
jgi:hypothetical protein